MISIENVSKNFMNRTVLDNISVSFEKGLVHGIVGRNGSGKSVLLKCICGLLPINSGSIIVDGLKIGVDIDVPCSTGIIIEAPGFLGNFSGFENLKMLAELNGNIGKDAICNAIQIVGLDPNDKKQVNKYSMGMRQRLGIAQAIMEAPKLLLFDEPMNWLDDIGMELVRNLIIHQKNNGTTIVMATHNKDDIHDLCDRIYDLRDGKIYLH